MITACAYIRVSHEEQSEGWSLDAQEQLIWQYAEKFDYSIVQVYRDEASGSTAERPGLEQLLMDAHAGLFQTVLIVHTSRFFRNLLLAKKYKNLLREKLNIELIFLSQEENSEALGFTAEAMNELLDEYYLQQTKFWTRLGKKHGRNVVYLMALCLLVMLLKMTNL